MSGHLLLHTYKMRGSTGCSLAQSTDSRTSRPGFECQLCYVARCVTLGELLNLSEPLQNEDAHNNLTQRVQRGVNELNPA